MAVTAAISTPAYVPAFEEDVFISYGHVDNDAPTKGWVCHLHEQLEGRLRQLLGVTTVRIWRDRNLGGADDFNDVLEQKVSRTALFLSVLSPRYVTSPSCANEVRWFLEAARRNGGIRVESQSRIIRVLKTPLQGAPEPNGLKQVDTLDFRFYREQYEDFDEFPANPGMPGYSDFQQQCEKLAKAINHLLRRMREEKQSAVQVARPRTFFLAETTKDLRQSRETIRNELTERGHRVVPETGLPTGYRDEFEASLADLLPSCDFAIHLLGKHYGAVPEGEETRSVVRLQYEWVRTNRTEDSFRQLLWIPEDLQDLEPRQKDFISWVENAKQQPGEARTETFRTSLSSFKEDLLDLIAVKSRPGPDQTPNRSKSIYLLCEQRDLVEPNFQEIRSYLLNQGYPIDLPAFEGDPGELREAERISVVENDATLIFYGSAKDLWVKLKRKALLSALAESGKCSSRAIYLGSPDNDVKKGVYLVPGGTLHEPGPVPPLLILGDCGPFMPEKLQPFLRRLESD